jgi:Domain of unknown function (DUF6429)
MVRLVATPAAEQQALKRSVILLRGFKSSSPFVDSVLRCLTYFPRMECDDEKIDEMVLALLYLTTFTNQGFVRAWKGHDWDALNRLHEKGFISDPKNKNKSVALSAEGAKQSEELFFKFFGKGS